MHGCPELHITCKQTNLSRFFFGCFFFLKSWEIVANTNVSYSSGGCLTPMNQVFRKAHTKGVMGKLDWNCDEDDLCVQV